jgi:TonB family protein
MLSVLAAILMQAAAPSQAGPAPAVATPPKPSVVTNPDWLRKPSGEDMAKFYPKAAADAHIEGRAVLHCSVTAAGDLADCTASNEDPPGQGFAEAALGVSNIFKMRPQTRDGVPIAGGKINIPIRFALPRPPPSTEVTLHCYGYAAAEAERNPTSDAVQAGLFTFSVLIQARLLAEHSRPSEVAEVLASQRKIAAAKLDDPKFQAERAECGAVLPPNAMAALQRNLAAVPR